MHDDISKPRAGRGWRVLAWVALLALAVGAIRWIDRGAMAVQEAIAARHG